jgi:hypothetical protein
MSKFLLTLLLQNPKNQFLIQKFFFLIFGPTDLAAHPGFGPAGSRWHLSSRGPNPTLPFSLLVHAFPSRLPLPHPSDNRTPAISSVPYLQPPELARAATNSWPPSATQLCASGATEPLPPRLHFPPLISLLNPPPSTMALKPLTPALTTPTTPPRRSEKSTTPNPVILVPKFLESLPLSFYAFV